MQRIFLKGSGVGVGLEFGEFFFLVDQLLKYPWHNVQFQKISMPTPWKVNGNSKGVGSQKPKCLKESMGLNWNFRRGGGIQTKKPSVGRVWIFSGTTKFIFK